MTSTDDSTPIEGSINAETEMSSAGNSFNFSQSASFVENPATDLDLDDSDDRASSISTISTISYLDDAEQEWQESLQQLELLMSLVLIPFFGKWVGRRCAYWGTHPLCGNRDGWLTGGIAWTKFMTWKYPVEVVVTDKNAFSLSGVVGVLSTPPSVVSPPL
jgi:hypothetical protein